ncbi:hypothetical protein [Luteolibacter soli]|uniref:Uncharacterized protein n=1 Tax=Luteolibacter soli TaxID=3135280 RepID=A0ABU9B0V5_9BACT
MPSEIPNEIGILYQLRLRFPDRLYSELLDAFNLARTIMPVGSREELQTVAAYILETAVPRQPHREDASAEGAPGIQPPTPSSEDSALM